MAVPSPLEGSCACGATSFKATAAPTSASYCHCKTCQKALGYAPFGYFAAPSIKWSGDVDTRIVDLSDIASRAFCSKCGSALWMKYHCDQITDNPGYHVVLGLIDEATARVDIPKPRSHIFVSQKPSWYDIPDSDEQHEAFNPEFQKTLDNWRATLTK